ncbi:MAG: hypothetical protein WA476_02040 [Acidobacteriaceae bacterium]
MQVCELVPEEDWVQTVCEALTQEMAACAGSEPRNKTARKKKLFKVTSAQRLQRLDNVAIAISLQKPEVPQDVAVGPAKVSSKQRKVRRLRGVLRGGNCGTMLWGQLVRPVEIQKKARPLPACILFVWMVDQMNGWSK